jgi:hypothetical protein
MLRPTVSRPVWLEIKYDQIFLVSCRFADMGSSLWRENGSVVLSYFWPSSAQSFSCLSPMRLATIFTVTDMRLPFSSPPTTRRVTVEVFDPASTQGLTILNLTLLYNHFARTEYRKPFPKIILLLCVLPIRCLGTVSYIFACVFISGDMS